jgi:enoyl-CoA hydratase
MSVLLEEQCSKGVVLLTLNRPEARNALNIELRKCLAEIFERLACDESVRCVVITGNEKAFAAGADISVLANATPMEVQQLNLHGYWRAIAKFPKPIIAAVNGYALGGGCELAMHSDIIIAGESANFGQPEVKLGIMPGAGGTQRLLRLVGSKKTMRLLLTGELISAEEAYQWGLVSRLCEDNKVVEKALAMARDIAAQSHHAVAHIKECVNLGQDLPLESALELERRSFNMLFDTPEQKSLMAAFLNKSKSKQKPKSKT